MALDVVGSGLGRTGTMSLKLALEQLGFGPCHHMLEVFRHPESVPLWIQAGAGNPDWDAIFADFHSAVDYPSAKFWREIAAYYPKAKVLHSVRDPHRWYESTQETIFSPNSPAMNAPPALKPFFGMISEDFGAYINDRDFMVKYFERHTEDVKAAIPAERLLIFEVSQGWAPLCKFLGVPIPDTPFPRENSREEFKARISTVKI